MDQSRRRFLRFLGIGAAVAAGELLLPHRKIWQVGAKICSSSRAFGPEDAFVKIEIKNKGEWIDEHEWRVPNFHLADSSTFIDASKAEPTDFIGYNRPLELAPGQLKYRGGEALISYPDIPTTIKEVEIAEANITFEGDRIKVSWNSPGALG